MSLTYAGNVNELGLLEASILPARKCTVPLFGGYEGVKVLDFTNVHIVDDDLRFLIKLGRLQAIGLSGTKITDKGLKYLGTHALFKATLQCIKLCYIETIATVGLEQLCTSFTRLREVDLWGCDQLGIADMRLICTQKGLTKIRLPAHVQATVDERHCHYRELSQKHTELMLSSKQIDHLTDGELKAQLKLHRKFFTDIFLVAPRESLLKRLRDIVSELEIQEKLYSLM